MINVLQIGAADWSQSLQLPEEVKWYFNDFESTKKLKKTRFGLLIIDGKIDFAPEKLERLHARIDPYNVVFTAENITDENLQYFLVRTQARRLTGDRQNFVNAIPKYYYSGQQGLGIAPSAFSVSPGYRGIQHWKNSALLELTVDSPDWEPLVNARMNVFVDPGRQLAVWPVFQHDPDVEVRYRFVLTYGSERQSFEFDESQLQEPRTLPTPMIKSNQFMTMIVFAKGSGQLALGNVEFRWSRYEIGTFINGGQAKQDPKTRDEVQYFFNPGDLRPPLCVYFAGYHSKKSFEGFYMMKSMKVPYLLITDSRLEGGAFYTGAFFEKAIPEIINEHLQLLGFSKDQLVMSGISMGTYGAIKYGLKMQAHAVIAAKPLIHLGTIADRGRLQRPDEFDTSFDIANTLIGQLDSAALAKLDQDIIAMINQTDASKTALNIAYMKNDDYDPTALPALQKLLHGRNRQLNYYGLTGRHNDNSPGMLKWFLRQYKRILEDDFGR